MTIQKKKWGQVFLHDPNIIKKIIQHADPQPSEIVLEIGVGKGILSQELATWAQQLWLIELDPDWLQVTLDAVEGHPHIVARQMDILDFDFAELQRPCKIVANIPYYLSAKIIQHLVQHRRSITQITLMVQKEFAQKLCAGPGTKIYGSLTVFFQHYFDVIATFDVSRNCFYPKPNVDSCVITARVKSEDKRVNPTGFERFVRAVFHHRRKSIRNNIVLNYAHVQSSLLPSTVTGIAINTERADRLDRMKLIELYQGLEPILGSD